MSDVRPRAPRRSSRTTTNSAGSSSQTSRAIPSAWSPAKATIHIIKSSPSSPETRRSSMPGSRRSSVPDFRPSAPARARSSEAPVASGSRPAPARRKSRPLSSVATELPSQQPSIPQPPTEVRRPSIPVESRASPKPPAPDDSNGLASGSRSSIQPPSLLSDELDSLPPPPPYAPPLPVKDATPPLTPIGQTTSPPQLGSSASTPAQPRLQPSPRSQEPVTETNTILPSSSPRESLAGASTESPLEMTSIVTDMRQDPTVPVSPVEPDSLHGAMPIASTTISAPASGVAELQIQRTASPKPPSPTSSPLHAAESRPLPQELPRHSASLPLETSPQLLPADSPHLEKPLPPGPSLSEPIPTKPSASVRSHPPAQPKAAMKVEGKIPISGTFYLDPCLRQTLFNVPHQVSATADAVLTGASAYGDGSFNLTTGAPIGGMAALAKKYALPTDAAFESDKGGISLSIAVIDQDGGGLSSPATSEDGSQSPTRSKLPKKRTNARVQVTTQKGGVKFDIMEIDVNRQIDLAIETKSGDVLILLPDTYIGPVHVTSPEEPHWGAALKPLLQTVKQPHEGLYTTTVIPASVRQAAAEAAAARYPNGPPSRPKLPKFLTGPKTKALEKAVMKRIAEHIPTPFADPEQYLTMGVEGYTGFSKRSHSKIVVRTQKGTVAIGYRDTGDRKELEALGIRVGANSKPKSWWKTL